MVGSERGFDRRDLPIMSFSHSHAETGGAKNGVHCTFLQISIMKIGYNPRKLPFDLPLGFMGAHTIFINKKEISGQKKKKNGKAKAVVE